MTHAGVELDDGWPIDGIYSKDATDIQSVALENSIDLKGAKLFYYEAYKLEFADGHWRPFSPTPFWPVEPHVARPLLRQLEGFDVVILWPENSAEPEHSPLSCQRLAEKLPTNAHCLFETFDEAHIALNSGKFDDCEPGGVMSTDMAYCFRILKRHLRGKNLLELGPAEGVMTALLVSTGMAITVVEGSVLFCDSLRQRFPNIRVIQALFEDFKPEDRFDNIVLGHVLEHVEDPLNIMKQVRTCQLGLPPPQHHMLRCVAQRVATAHIRQPLATKLAGLPVGGSFDLLDYPSDSASRSRLWGGVSACAAGRMLKFSTQSLPKGGIRITRTGTWGDADTKGGEPAR